MEPISLPSSRPPSLTLSQLEAPTTPSHSTNLEQIHATNSAATGLTSFYLGSPPPSSPAPLTLNKLYSKVKSVAAGMREAVREAVVTGPSSSYRSGINDSKESFENFSAGGSSNRASPTTSTFQFRSRYNNPHRLSLSNASIMTRASTGSNSGIPQDSGSPSVLRKVNILSPGPKSTTSPSLAQVTVFRDGTGGVEVNGGGVGFNYASKRASNGGAFGVGSVATSYSTPPSPVPEDLTFSNRYSALQDQVEGNDDNSKVGGDGVAEEEVLSGAIEEDNGDLGRDPNSSSGGKNPPYPDSQGHTSTPGTNHKELPPGSTPAQVALSSTTSLSNVPQPARTPLNSGKRKSSTGGQSSAKSMRKRPKSVKRTSESLLPGFSYNTGSDTEDEDNTSSPADTSSVGASTALQANGTRNRVNRPTASALSTAGGVRALAGWFGVGGSISENQSSDRSVISSGGAIGSGGAGGNIEAVGLALQQLRKGTLTKEFWMKDENCKDCYLCGRTFNAFRRKHHCRKSTQLSRSLLC